MIKLDFFVNEILKTNKEFAKLIAVEIEKMTEAIIKLQIEFAKK